VADRPAPHPLRRQRRRRPLVAGGGGLVVIAVAAGVTLWATGASGSSGFRTATVTKQTVTQTLGLSAAAEPVQEATAAFQVAGTVSKVKIAVGQKVKAGQSLASLTTSTLQQDVTLAQSTLAAAKAQLSENELDESAATVSTTAADFGPATGVVLDASVTPATPVTTATTTPGGGKKKLPPGGKTKPTGGSSLTRAQQAVVSAQRTADADSEQAAATLAEAQTACGPATTPTSSTTSTTVPTSTTTSSPTTTVPTSTTTSSPTTTVPTSFSTTTVSTSSAADADAAAETVATSDSPARRPGPPRPTPTTTTTTVAAPVPTSGGSSACAEALAHALAAQQQVSTDQRAVSTAETALAKVLSTAAASTGSKSGSGTGGTGGTSTRTGGTGSPSTGTSGSTGTGSTSRSSTATTGAASDSAEQLASDQATIDNDQASLIDAQVSLANAVLTSPISGTVAVVDLAAGQSVSAGSTTASITVINSGSFEATASLTSTQVAQVKVGDTALVTVDGVNGTLSGTVSRVGPVDSSSSGYTYPLVVALPAGAHGISGGSTAQVQVVLHQVTYALAVPTSAVHTTGVNVSYVLVLKGGHETRTTVSVGAVGSAYTQITSGLEPGMTVVLADLSTPIPASSNTTTGRFGGRTLPGGGTGFTGGGGGFARAGAAAG
jgi:multidrug efflux pump subunit AcrA (membrane-fusion protein)